MSLSLVPFGLNEASGDYVEVAEVERGLGGYMCPSCKAPLIARKGTVNAWHFAHATSHADGKPVSACKYSFYVSVRMMARQLFGVCGEFFIHLPAYEGSESIVCDETGEYINERYEVAPEQTLRLDNIGTDVQLHGTTFDVAGDIGGFPFGIFFAHPARDSPTLDDTVPKDARFGAIAIRFNSSFRKLLLSPESAGVSYRQTLEKFISNPCEAASWIFHPRRARCVAQARSSIVEKLTRSETGSPPNLLQQRASLQPTEQKVLYRCAMCGSEWMATESNGDSCPEGHEKIFATKIR